MYPIAHAPADQAAWHALRQKDVTSTEAAALFGLSPYLTEFELHHRKKSPEPVVFEANERMKWGNRLQDAIAAGVAEELSWTIEPFREYLSIPELRMGSSFDYRVVEGKPGSFPDYALTRGILEIKNVDSLAFRDGWLKDGDHIEAPEHIEVQVQHQLHVSGYDWACIAALVGGNKLEYLFRKRDQAVGTAIQHRIAKFWQRFDAGQEPSPDFLKDAETISRLYGYAEPGKIRDARDDEKIATLCARYAELGKTIKNGEEEREAIKAELLTRIGDAEKVLANGYTISAGLVGPAEISYTRNAYRSFKINPKKAKS